MEDSIGQNMAREPTQSKNVLLVLSYVRGIPLKNYPTGKNNQTRKPNNEASRELEDRSATRTKSAKIDRPRSRLRTGEVRGLWSSDGEELNSLTDLIVTFFSPPSDLSSHIVFSSTLRRKQYPGEKA